MEEINQQEIMCLYNKWLDIVFEIIKEKPCNDE